MQKNLMSADMFVLVLLSVFSSSIFLTSIYLYIYMTQMQLEDIILFKERKERRGIYLLESDFLWYVSH
jgi:hypothetical protein